MDILILPWIQRSKPSTPLSSRKASGSHWFGVPEQAPSGHQTQLLPNQSGRVSFEVRQVPRFLITLQSCVAILETQSSSEKKHRRIFTVMLVEPFIKHMVFNHLYSFIIKLLSYSQLPALTYLAPKGFFDDVSSHGIHILISLNLLSQQSDSSSKVHVLPSDWHLLVSFKGISPLPHL